MKKTVSILLAVMLLALSSCACADTLTVQPGGATGVTLGVFRAIFDAFSASAGYPYVWEEAAVSEDGYTVYTARAEGSVFSVKVYTTDGFVSYVTGSAEGYTVKKADDAQKIGEWLGATMTAAAATLYFSEGGDTGDEMAAALSDDISAVVTDLSKSLGNKNKVTEGVVSTESILGYPVGLEVRATSVEIPATLYLKFAVVGKDGQL